MYRMYTRSREIETARGHTRRTWKRRPKKRRPGIAFHWPGTISAPEATSSGARERYGVARVFGVSVRAGEFGLM